MAQTKQFDPSEYASDHRVAYLIDEWKRLTQAVLDAHGLAESDANMKEMAVTELAEIAEQKNALILQIELITKGDESEREMPNEMVLEIRAGAGGDEAALFAEELSRMYLRYAERQKWATKKLHESRNSLGGVKEVAFEIRGKGCFEQLRFETGVHRVQRIPETETQGRIHTSPISVAIVRIYK